MPYFGIKRKVFVSYHHSDQSEVEDFISLWAERESVFIPKALGVSDEDDLINSTNPEYVMNRIRQDYLGDSSVTMVMVGKCTHSRRYVDWEIKTSLRRGLTYTPNGLFGVVLPSCGTSARLPPRFEENWNSSHSNCYAKYWVAPASADQLANWIEQAYVARTSMSNLINNSQDMMKYNARCQICGITH